jgi:hypothetical protein
MRLVVGSTLIFAALSAVVLLFLDGRAELLSYEVLIVVLAVFARRRLRDPSRPSDPPTDRWWKAEGDGKRSDVDRPPQLEHIERLVTFGQSSALDAEKRLLPVLREIAGQRLAARHGVDLYGEPEPAERLLGAVSWGLLRPDRDVPGDVWSGLSLDELAATVAAIEAL